MTTTRSKRVRTVALGAVAGVAALLWGAPVGGAQSTSAAGCPALSPGDPSNTTGFSPPVDWAPVLRPASCRASLRNTAQVGGAASASATLDGSRSNWIAAVHFAVTDRHSGALLAHCDASESVPVASSPVPPGDTNCSVSTVIFSSTGQPTVRDVDALCSVSGVGVKGEYFCQLQQ